MYRRNPSLNKVLQLVVCGAALLLSTQAQAFRCGSKVIKTGDNAGKLLKYCGEPTNIEQRIIYRNPFVTRESVLEAERATVEGGTTSIGRRGSEEVRVETWTYDYGKRKLTRIVRLDNGIVTDLETGGYGD